MNWPVIVSIVRTGVIIASVLMVLVDPTCPRWVKYLLVALVFAAPEKWFFWR